MRASRKIGAAATAAAAAGAGVAFLLGEAAPTWALARETLPLALAVGAVVGWLGYPRRPKTPWAGALRGFLVVLAGLGLFLLAYATADAVIESAKQAGGTFGGAWGAASLRVLEDLWLAGPAALAFGAVAGVAVSILAAVSGPPERGDPATTPRA